MRLDPKQMMARLTARQIVGVARARVCARHPYFSDLLWKLRLTEVPGHGTMSVDDGMRLFYDPEQVKAWGVEHTPTILAHEVQHVRRKHAARGVALSKSGLQGVFDRKRQAAAKLGITDWQTMMNYAFDVEINDEVDRAGWTWPPDFIPLRPTLFGLPNGKTAEYYLREMLTRMPEDTDEEANAKAPGNGKPSDACAAPQGQQASGEGGGAVAQSGGKGKQTDRGPAPQAGEGEAGKAVAAPGDDTERDTGSGDGEGDAAPDEDGEGGDASGGDTDEGDDDAGAGNADGGADSNGPALGVGNGGCGGCAGHAVGKEKEQSDDYPDKATPEEVEGTLCRMAEAVRSWKPGNGRGLAPGDEWMQWAEAMFAPPTLDPMKLLEKEVRMAVASAQGHTMRKWNAPNRRRGVLQRLGWGDEAPLLPVARGPRPRVVLVLDRSGSMGWGENTRASRATNEALGFVKAAHGDAYGIAVDAQVQAAMPVRSAADLLKLSKGGGGTDMRVGLRAAAEPKLRADIIILLTDGETAWLNADEMPRQRIVTVVISESASAMHSLPQHFRSHAVFVPVTTDADD